MEEKKTERNLENALRRSDGRKKRLTEKLEALEKIELTMWFITITLNGKRKKDRLAIATIKSAIKNALRKNKNQMYYTYVLEQHKKGGWHVHMVADTLTMQWLINHYTAGFTYIEPINGNVKNEMSKYLGKAQKGATKLVSSKTLSKSINAEKGIEKRIKNGRYNQ